MDKRSYRQYLEYQGLLRTFTNGPFALLPTEREVVVDTLRRTGERGRWLEGSIVTLLCKEEREELQARHNAWDSLTS